MARPWTRHKVMEFTAKAKAKDERERKSKEKGTDLEAPVEEVGHGHAKREDIESNEKPPSRGGLYQQILQLNRTVLPADSRLILTKESAKELKYCRKYLTKHLLKGHIKRSSAPYASPAYIGRMPNGKLRFCVDFSEVNSTMKKDPYPMPVIDEIIQSVSRGKIFTKLTVRKCFHHLKLHPDSTYLTTFHTPYGLFEYKVLTYGMGNAPFAFQGLIDKVLDGYLNDFVNAYIDEILIYSETLEEHIQHVKRVLKRLRVTRIRVDVDKCVFHVKSTKFLGISVPLVQS